MKKKTLMLLSAGLILSFSFTSEAQNQKDKDKQNQGTTTGGNTMDAGTRETKDKGMMTEADKSFLKKASNAGMYEIEAANLAIEKSSSPEIKDYAKMMVDHHTKGSQELEAIMSSKGVAESKELTGEEKNMLDKLKTMNGKEFDTAYKDQMVKSHKKAVKLYEDASKTVKDKEIKSHASEKLPVLKKHLESAQKIDNTRKS